MTKEIRLSGKYGHGKSAIVDDCVYEWASKIKWSFDGKYVRNSHKVRLHRMIMNPKESEVVDHINHNTLDNSRENLRVCTQSENLQNRSLEFVGAYGYRGVRLMQGKYIQAFINIGGKQKSLGCYKNYEDAARAYDDAAVKYRGDFAVLNFPQRSG